MRKLQLIIVALSLMAAAAAAQSPAKILKDAERALGGGKALGRITTVEKRGKITRLADDAAGTVLIQSQRPNLYNISFDIDRKSTRLNSSHSQISYAVFCLKK